MAVDHVWVLQAYASNYTGNVKINRLIFIAENTADSTLALSALKIAADDLKKVCTHDLQRPYVNNS